MHTERPLRCICRGLDGQLLSSRALANTQRAAIVLALVAEVMASGSQPNWVAVLLLVTSGFLAAWFGTLFPMGVCSRCECSLGTSERAYVSGMARLGVLGLAVGCGLIFLCPKIRTNPAVVPIVAAVATILCIVMIARWSGDTEG